MKKDMAAVIGLLEAGTGGETRRTIRGLWSEIGEIREEAPRRE